MVLSLRTAFDRSFNEICTDLNRMTQLVESAIEKSLYALKKRDQELAKQILLDDDQIDNLRYRIEEACLELIATQQPIAGDLRAVVAVMHIVVEIERIGDYATGIGKTVILMYEEPLLKTLKKIFKMGDVGKQMLSDSVQAFLSRDVERAREIAKKDQEVDEMYQAVFNRLVEVMAHKPEMVTRATYLMWCAHNLERIADRVTNIAERTIFMATGDFRELNS
jgi:phosphate transport system protein